jgi:hypothetical protein
LEEWRDANNLKAIQSKWTKNDNGGCRRCTYQVRGRNLAGKIMGSWTVTGNRRKDPIVLVNGVETTQIQWLCRCLNCGITEKWLSTGYLKSVEGGCGCKKRTLDGKSKTREGRIFTGAKRRAMLEGIPFDICLEDIDIPTHCPVLGIEISTENSELLDNSPSLDKFYPAAGYVRGNVQVISWKANRLKSNGTPEEWLRVAEWCQREDVKKRLAGE